MAGGGRARTHFEKLGLALVDGAMARAESVVPTVLAALDVTASVEEEGS
jgi:hypothetical protein